MMLNPPEKETPTDSATDQPQCTEPKTDLIQVCDRVAQLAQIDEAGTIHAELPCTGCGYALKERTTNADCPECGRPVKDALDEQRLIFLNPSYLQRLLIGSILIPIGVLTTPFFFAGVLVIIVATPLMLIDPNDHSKQRHPLKWVAGLSLLTLLACWGYLLINLFGWNSPDEYTALTVFLVGLASFLTHLAAMTRWMGQLGLRSGSKIFRRSARIFYGIIAVYVALWISFLVLGFVTDWNWGLPGAFIWILATVLYLTPLALYLLYAGTHAHFAWHTHKVCRLSRVLHKQSDT